MANNDILYPAELRRAHFERMVRQMQVNDKMVRDLLARTIDRSEKGNNTDEKQS